MVMFGTVQAWGRKFGKPFGFVGIAVASIVLGQAASAQSSTIIAVEDVEQVSLVTVSGGYAQGFRPGMKLLAHGSNGVVGELIALDVTEQQTNTLIIELFGDTPLKEGNPVTIKTINFAAKWK